MPRPSKLPRLPDLRALTAMLVLGLGLAGALTEAAAQPAAAAPAADPAPTPAPGRIRDLIGGGVNSGSPNTANPAAPAAKPGLGAGYTPQAFLKPDQAFILSTRATAPDRIEVRFDIADEYYLYRDKFKVRSTAPGVELGAPLMPPGETKFDEYFGEQVVYHAEMIAEIPVLNAAGLATIPLEVSFQGCADAGLCYPPLKRLASVEMPRATSANATATATANANASVAAIPGTTQPPRQSEQDTLADRIRSGSLLGMLTAFFVIGLGLSLTPCVLPMVPIVSGIIVGAGRDRPVSRGRAFSLSVAYVLGMALTYTIAGALFAAAGQQAQAFFQQPWMIVTFAALFVLLALGMFGTFTLQMPAAFQSRIDQLSARQKQGTLAGTAAIGALSSLIVTACVAPALVASLAVIGEGGNILRGALALFAMSLGMGAPLLLVGASAGTLLPKAGAWMNIVKAAFGVMLLGVAIWMLSRILPGPVTLALWAALAFVSGWCLMWAVGLRSALAGAGALAMVYGVLLLIGALTGRSDPLQPLAGIANLSGTNAAASDSAARSHLPFRRIKSLADLERELAAARAAQRPLMLDFYADWCVSCKEMEKYTFTDADVQRALSTAVLLQADVTANDDTDQALMQRFGILGPPSILFFGSDGVERPAYRLVGFKPAAEFGPHVQMAFAAP